MFSKIHQTNSQKKKHTGKKNSKVNTENKRKTETHVLYHVLLLSIHIKCIKIFPSKSLRNFYNICLK